MSVRLRAGDLRTLQRCVAELYALGDLAGFPGRVAAVVSSAVRSDVVVYAEVDPRRGAISWNPAASAALRIADGPRIYGSYLGELPLFASYRRGQGSAVKISDFVTQRQFRRTGLYNEFYRRVGLEYHMAKGLPGAPRIVTALAILRRGRDFSERERLLLNLLGPHLNQSYLNAAAVTRMTADLALARSGLDALGHGVVIVAGDGGVALATDRARRLLAEYFPPPRNGALPDRLGNWLRRSDEPSAGGDAPPARAPLVIAGAAGHLTIRVIRDDDRRILLFAEHAEAPGPRRLEEALGLSTREAEVLAWVAAGKTNPEIGVILGVSARTVDKHLQHVFAKLGVETRTTAAARALSLSPI